ncbi:hypothetical protein [Methylocystis echinoides]|jgi:hypothetical protein|uniref:hypothetical protein n=1 Tax=Methylocystis echinoides TaxID=29468 RepID=UPI00342A30D9
MEQDGRAAERITSQEDWGRIDREWRSSKRAILAYHIGGWRKGESPLDALARALDVAAVDVLSELTDPKAGRAELDQLSSCLETGHFELPGLNIEESVALVIELLNEKLAYVPNEVRSFFGAPQMLEPLLAHGRNERRAVLRRFN